MPTGRSSWALITAGLLAAACGGGKSGPSETGGGSGKAGFAVPQEISALPAKSAEGAPPAATKPSDRALRLEVARAALAADSDYEKAQTFKFVDERALSQFDIINTLFAALEQTHYADPENVGSGAFGAMVAWTEERGGGQNVKRLVPWVVDSTLIVEDGEDVNRVRIWMTETTESGDPVVIRAELEISEPPTQRQDGSYSDYGVWRIDAALDPQGTAFFVASASRAEDGSSVVMVHESEGPGRRLRGVMRRSDESGYGKVVYQECFGFPCAPQDVTVAYVYDADHVALQQGDEVRFRDRDAVVDLVHRYGLFDAATGADVAKARSFGFPVRYADGTGRQRHGYYGAWQGRHQLWSDGAGGRVPAGTTVVRADRPPNQAAESYTVSAPFTGTLVKRTLAPAAIDDVKGLVVELYEHDAIRLTRSGDGWTACVNPQWNPYPEPMTCEDGPRPFGAAELATLVNDPANPRRVVNVDYMAPWDPQSGAPQPYPVNLVYALEGPAGEGFYETDWQPGSWQPPTSNGTPFTVPDGESIWAHVGGPVYIAYDGAGWVEKTVVSYDQATWTATFADGGSPYALELGREYYIHNPGANYVVERTGENAYDVRIELQSVANPLNASTFVPAGTIFTQQFNGAQESTFRFVTDRADPLGRYMKLVYDAVRGRDEQNGAQSGQVVQTPMWGLVATIGGEPTQFNWDYPQDGQDWGSQQFLLAGDAPVLLDDPIRLSPMTLRNVTGERTFSLQFDGAWVAGLPDVYRDLERSDFEITPDIMAKIFTIPAGTEVIDAVTGAHYLFKPLQTRQYLASIADPGDLSLTAALALDLATVPGFVPHGMGARPDVPVRYSEGKRVE